ncbi:polysaccharide deacetylase [Bifidobacterium lemurum]|uniref:Polysaccharide deacetylase n=1 Tax=Bifidobacterium lemurum TaxID=1603886 RepID=A0A261FNF2_9BIFI|nr:polysaccharide deacetylase family protein [Bifidobacterium lemurum]OZG60659.1 polysaccharide deacetylase [Bifidobacterium lemurum]QOL34821.1 polysaccharide deacetylase family protein [Bifidobacterium lemurum]
MAAKGSHRASNGRRATGGDHTTDKNRTTGGNRTTDGRRRSGEHRYAGAHRHSSDSRAYSHGGHVSRRSARAAVRQARTQRLAALAVVVACALAALTLVIAPFAAPTLMRGRDTTTGTGSPNPPTVTHATLERTAAPELSPGGIVIGVNGSPTTIMLKGEEYVEGGAHAIDPDDGVLTAAIQTSGTVDADTAGDYTVTYSVRNSKGNLATATRTVRVVDSMETQNGGIPVLMYHYVYDDATPPADLNNNYIAASALEQQLRYLTDNGFYYPSWHEVRAFIDGTHSLPKRSVVLTFDDGEPGFMSVGGALLARYQVPATSFIIANDGNAPQRMKDYATPYLEYQSHSYAMHQAGGNVGHGGRISAMTKQEIIDDLKQSAAVTGALDALAYPFGDTTPDAIEAVREAGVLCAFTTQYGWANIGDDPMVLDRVRIQGTGSLETFIGAIQ